MSDHHDIKVQEITLNEAIGFDHDSMVEIGRKQTKDGGSEPIVESVLKIAQLAIDDVIALRKAQEGQAAFMTTVFNTVARKCAECPMHHPTDVIKAVCGVWELALVAPKGHGLKEANRLKGRVAVLKSTLTRGSAMGIIPGTTSAQITHLKRGKPGTPMRPVTETIKADTYNAVRVLAENWTKALTDNSRTKYPMLEFQNPPVKVKEPAVAKPTITVPTPGHRAGTVPVAFSLCHELFVSWANKVKAEDVLTAIDRFGAFLKNENERLSETPVESKVDRKTKVKA